MQFSLVIAAIVSLAAPADVQKSIDTFVAKAPGVVVAVGTVQNGEAHEYFGGTPPPGAPKLDDSAEFQIGSVSKTFTSTILAQMVLDGEVNLDDPIGKYLPKGVKAPSFHGKQITLLNLAEQNSGLPRLPTNLAIDGTTAADPYATYDAKQLYAFLNSYELTRAPGEKFEYSNLGVGLLGQLLANAEHTTYPQLVERRIFKPLAMRNSSAKLSPAISSKMMPGFAVDLSPSKPWTLTGLAGAGAINSTLHDMMAYLQANINAPNGVLGRAMALAHAERAPTDLGSKIALNWLVGPSGVVWHNGETGGYSSFIAFDPNSKTGVVVLTNVAPMNGETDLLASHILESERYPTIVAITPPPSAHGNSPFVGVYELTPAFKITVFEEGGTLYGQATGQPRFALVLKDGTTYTVQGVDASVTFNRDANGRVDSLVLHQNGDHTAKRVSP